MAGLWPRQGPGRAAATERPGTGWAERRHDCCDGPGALRLPLEAWQPKRHSNHNSPLPNGLSRGPISTANANKHASPRYGQHKTNAYAPVVGLAAVDRGMLPIAIPALLILVWAG